MSDDNIIDLHSHDDEKLEALYQQADKPLPPTHVDAAIKQAAHAPLTPKRPKLSPWFASIAASVLVGVLFIRLYPTALPPRPASYLEQESQQVSTPAAEIISPEPAQPSPTLTDAVRDTPEKAIGNLRMNQIQQPPDTYNAAEHKREMLPSPARKSMSSSGASIKEADMAFEIPAEASALPKQDNAPEPQVMLDYILELLDQGKTEDAKQKYLEFRQHHPDYELEPEIKQRLKVLL